MAKFLSYKECCASIRTCKSFQKGFINMHKYGYYPVDCLRVPEDCQTLNDAVEKVYNSNGNLTTIVVNEGYHVIKGGTLTLKCSMNIIGRYGVDKTKIRILGSLFLCNKYDLLGSITGKEYYDQPNKPLTNFQFHLENMVICGKNPNKTDGIIAKSSFSINNVIIENWFRGMVVSNPYTVARCTNIEVRHCSRGGIVAKDCNSIILTGPYTTIHHNCCEMLSDYDEDRGLEIQGDRYGENAGIIRIIFPLVLVNHGVSWYGVETIEVSTKNGPDPDNLFGSDDEDELYPPSLNAGEYNYSNLRKIKVGYEDNEGAFTLLESTTWTQ